MGGGPPSDRMQSDTPQRRREGWSAKSGPGRTSIRRDLENHNASVGTPLCRVAHRGGRRVRQCTTSCWHDQLLGSKSQDAEISRWRGWTRDSSVAESTSTIRRGPLDVAVGESQRDRAVAVNLLQCAVAKAHSAAAAAAVSLLLARYGNLLQMHEALLEGANQVLVGQKLRNLACKDLANHVGLAMPAAAD